MFPATAPAQDLPGGGQLGMTPGQLQQAVPLQRIDRPQRMAGGLVGSWRGHSATIAGVPLEPTFFFAQGELRRVEYLQSPARAGAYDALLAWGRARWGGEMATQEPEGRYATWAQGEEDAYLQLTGTAQLRLVIKRRVLKDASEL